MIRCGHAGMKNQGSPWLLVLAEKYPGRQFSIEVTIQENHNLVVTGPYELPWL